MYRKFIASFCGKLKWIKFNIQFKVKYNTLVMCLYDNDEMLNSAIINNVEEYMKTKYFNKLLIICNEEVETSIKIMLNKKKPDVKYYIDVWLNKDIDNLLQLYKLQGLRIIWVSFTQPEDNYLKNMLGVKNIDMDTLVKNSFLLK